MVTQSWETSTMHTRIQLSCGEHNAETSQHHQPPNNPTHTWDDQPATHPIADRHAHLVHHTRVIGTPGGRP